ncbi:hypothetical protein LC593_07895 [Nostoc sp. CHAB 5844]|nr:hypothetical protein [Nostoc sp. CHAB 5844]
MTTEVFANADLTKATTHEFALVAAVNEGNFALKVLRSHCDLAGFPTPSVALLSEKY